MLIRHGMCHTVCALQMLYVLLRHGIGFLHVGWTVVIEHTVATVATRATIHTATVYTIATVCTIATVFITATV